MSLVLKDGFYRYKNKSKRLETSDHPVYQAGIKLQLAKGSWGYFPNAGHDLDKYRRRKKTDENVLALKKELRLYLQEYDPEVQEKSIERFAEEFEVNI